MDLFWRSCLKEKNGPIKLSDDLKELIQMMLSPSQFDRPSLSEIKCCVWLNEPAITNKEVQCEFLKREEVLLKLKSDHL